MKWNWKLPEWKMVLPLLQRYKVVLLVLVAGVVLLMWPTSSPPDTAAEAIPTVVGEETFSVAELEERVADALSQIEGAGKATVVLTLDRGVERVLASDTVTDQSGEDSSVERSTVILSGEEGEEAVLVTQEYPSFRGALVVCPGGDDPQVQLLITQAVSALTGLSSSRITVCGGG